MERELVDSKTDKNLVSAVLSCSAHSDGLARQGRSKAAVAFSEGAEKGRLSADAAADGQHSVKKSGMYPMQRRGSRKQTLSLNPEEREALENLIEEVIMDGMDDGVVDSDGSSSDDDDDEKNDSPVSNRGSCNAEDNTLANNGAKVNNSGNAIQSGVIGGKKYYPGQLKVALKHMTNLPPRFVRKLAKAQQYLDATGNGEVPARPTTIVGRIEEEEEVAAATQVKDEGRLMIPAASGGLSPVSGQQDRDSKSKLKENKLKEAKKQIRTLLCDKDQYIDENALASSNTVPIKGNTEVSAPKAEGNNYKVPVITSDTLTGISGPRQRAENTDKSTDTPIKNAAGISNFISPRAAAARTAEVAAAVISHAGQMQTFSVTPALSVNVPDFVPKSSPALPLGFGSSPSAPGSSFNRYPHSVAPVSPVQPDAYGRPMSASAAVNDPRYYVRSAAVPSQPANYYGMPHVYNTPPPTVSMSSGVVGELLPPASSLVQAASINGVGLTQSGSYSMPGQYGVQPFSGIYSSPYLQHPSQSLHNNVYMSYPTSSHGKPVAYRMPEAVNGTYGIGNVPTASEARSAVEFQYGIRQPSTHGSYTSEALTFAQFSGVEQNQQHLGRTSVSLAGGTVEFASKPHIGQTRWPSGGSSTSSPVRPGMQQTNAQNTRFPHFGATSAKQMVSPRNMVYLSRPLAGSGVSVPNSSVNNAVNTSLHATPPSSTLNTLPSPQQSIVNFPSDSVHAHTVFDSGHHLSPQTPHKSGFVPSSQLVNHVSVLEDRNLRKTEHAACSDTFTSKRSMAADVLSGNPARGISYSAAEFKNEEEQSVDILSVNHENCVELSGQNVIADVLSNAVEDSSHCVTAEEDKPLEDEKRWQNSGCEDVKDTGVHTMCQACSAATVHDADCVTCDWASEPHDLSDGRDKALPCTVQTLVIDESPSTKGALLKTEEIVEESVSMDNRTMLPDTNCVPEMPELRTDSLQEMVVAVAEHAQVQLGDGDSVQSSSIDASSSSNAEPARETSAVSDSGPSISLDHEICHPDVSESEISQTDSSEPVSIKVALSRAFAERLMQMFAPQNIESCLAGNNR